MLEISDAKRVLNNKHLFFSRHSFNFSNKNLTIEKIGLFELFHPLWKTKMAPQ